MKHPDWTGRTAVVIANGPTLTYARLREVLRYEPDTGLFWWIERAPGRVLSRPAGTLARSNWYWIITIDYEQLCAHRLAWLYMTGAWPEHEVDHRNLVKNDNRWENLRAATHKQNSENSPVRKHSRTQIKGVHWDLSRGNWQAYLCHNYKKVHLGRYDDLLSAVAARKRGEHTYFTHSEQ